MQLKISKLAMLTMPCFIAMTLAACGGSSSSSGGGDDFANFDPEAPSIFVTSGGDGVATAPNGLTAPTTESGDVVEAPEGKIVVQLVDVNFGNGETTPASTSLKAIDKSADPMKFNLYLWDVCGEAGTITNKENWDDTSITPTAVNQYGPYWILDIVGDASADGCVNVIIRDADKNKLIVDDQLLKWTADDRSIAISAKRKESYASTKEAFEDLYSAAAGFEVETASAHWITKDLLVWKDAGNYKVRIQYNLDPIEVANDQLTGKFVNLTETTVPDDIKAKYPTLGGYKAFQVPTDSIDIKQALKGEVLVVGLDGNNLNLNVIR